MRATHYPLELFATSPIAIMGYNMAACRVLASVVCPILVAGG